MEKHMDLNLDEIEPIEPFKITVNSQTHEFDLLKILFLFRTKLGDKGVPDEPEELLQLLQNTLDLKLNLTQALIVFRVLTSEGEKTLDTLLKNVSGTSQASVTTSPESDSENSDG